jgi:ATP-dependent DNA helicase RecG
MLNINKKLKQLLSTYSENETLEFKEAKKSYDFNKIGKYFSALANEANLSGQNEAWLVFGVVDKNKTVVGTAFRSNAKDLHGLKREIAEKTTNGITFKEIYEVEIEGKRVVLFQIPSAPKGLPVAWSGHYYGRDGESLSPLNLEEIERIRKAYIEEDWSIGICSGATIDDLSVEAIDRAREVYTKDNPHLADEIQTWDNITFLNKAKITIDGKITRTAILLLGKSESEHYLSPAVAKISWILKDRDNIAKDYEHFYCPFLLSVDALFNKIRNLKYRYLMGDTIFPEEVDSYDPYIIREALNNCIAHQDYLLGGKINVVENEESQLIFLNSGSFIPKTIENVLNSDAPTEKYRNKFLAQAMVNLRMIDTIGSGISKMFRIQKEKFFPLPEYSFDNQSVKVVIEGKILDINYAKKLAQMPNLSLNDIILLDKVQKKKILSSDEARYLRGKSLIEGKRPNIYISSMVASHTNQEDDYMRLKGIDDAYAKKIIIDYLKQFKKAKRPDFEKVLLDKLPDILDEQQKKNKIKNYLQSLKKEGFISNIGKEWRMSNV